MGTNTNTQRIIAQPSQLRFCRNPNMAVRSGMRQGAKVHRHQNHQSGESHKLAQFQWPSERVKRLASILHQSKPEGF
jgi:hypothetical protein